MKHLILASSAMLLVLTGCQRKAEGQTVAVVNGEEITTPELNFALQQAHLPANVDKTAVQTEVLQRLVDRRLVAQQARKEGIDKTPEFLNRQREGTEGLLIQMLAARRMNAQQLPSERDVASFMDSNPQMFAHRETWTIDQVLYTPAKAATFAADIAKAHSMDGLIAVLQKYKLDFNRKSNKLDTAVVPQKIYQQLENLPAGEPFIVPAADKAVANVITSKEPHPLTGDQAKPIAVAAMRKMDTGKSLEQTLNSLRSSAKIEYQKGFAPPKGVSGKK